MASALPDFDVPPVQALSVVSMAYERIRTLIVEGDAPAGTRLGQVELAAQLGISRTPVREALRRLTGDGLVEFRDNRGFRVAELPIDDVVRRLEVRLLIEPGGASLAAERATLEDLGALGASIECERRAKTAVAAHDASRDFHLLLAAASQNRELVATVGNLWRPEVGRRLLSRRRTTPDWQEADLAEHEAILDAVRAGDRERAATEMEEHVRHALQHWQPELHKLRDTA